MSQNRNVGERRQQSTFLFSQNDKMAHREKERQARGLFVRGYRPSEVARELKMVPKTVERWFKKWQIEQGLAEPTINVKPKPKPTAIVKVDPEVVEQIQSATAEPKLLGFRGNYKQWDAAITNKFKELEEFHREERLINRSLRDKQMADGAINGREANSYSQAMARHGEQEFRMLLMGKSDLPTMSQSYAGMKTAGFTIVKTRIEDDTLSQSDTTSEIAGESGEGHGTTEG